MTDHKVGRRCDMVLVEFGVGHAKLVGHDDRITGFIKLRTKRIRRSFTVEQAVAWHRAVSLLLLIEQEVHGICCGLEISIKQETRPCFIEVTRKDLAVRTEESIVGITSRDGLPPR